MIDTETKTITTYTCDVCDNVVDSFCKPSLISENNRLIKDALDDELYPDDIYRVDLVVSSKEKATNHDWRFDECMDLCQKCFDSIQKHLAGLSKKEG